jgi:hypothetical protein
LKTQQELIKTKPKTELDYDITEGWTQEQLEKQHDLILKYGPKETSYCAAFEAEHFDVLVRFSEAIHALDKIQSDNYLSKYYFDQLERKYNDHLTCIEHNSQKIEITEATRTEDVPTIQGLAWCSKLAIQGNASSTFAKWQYVGAGSDDREARAYQSVLYAPTLPRANTINAAEGSITRSGESLRIIGIFPSTFATITVKESACFNASTGGTNLNRNFFPSNPIVHTVNTQPFTIGILINFNSVTRWG